MISVLGQLKKILIKYLIGLLKIFVKGDAHKCHLTTHWVKSVQIWSFFWSVFSVFSVFEPEKTPYLDTFHTVTSLKPSAKIEAKGKFSFWESI